MRQHVRAEGPLAVVGIDTWWLEIPTPVWRAPHDQALAQLQGTIERLRVLRPVTGDAGGLAAMHTAFLPIGLFPAGFGMPLAHSVAQQLEVWSLAIDRGTRAGSTTTRARHTSAITRWRSPVQQRVS